MGGAAMNPPATRAGKAAGAFRTIGEVAAETGVAVHVLRYWERHFPQLRPVTRAGGRRYYRPADVALVRRINDLLHAEGYTLRGARAAMMNRVPAAAVASAPPPPASDKSRALREIRDRLAAALARGDA